MWSGKVRVVRETQGSLIVERIYTVNNKAAHGSFDHKNNIFYPDRIRIPKSKLLQESDNLGIPDKRNDKDTRVSEGLLVIPKWLATQRGFWDYDEEITDQPDTKFTTTAEQLCDSSDEQSLDSQES